MAGEPLGQQAASVPLLVPFGDEFSEVVEFIDENDAPVDISLDIWAVTIIDPDDDTWVGPTIAVAAFTNLLTLSATAAALTVLDGRGLLRWKLRNESTGRTVLAGVVERPPEGHGRGAHSSGGIVVRYTDTTIQVVGPASTVVSGSGSAATASYSETFTAAVSVVINHNLGFQPGGIRVVDSGGDEHVGFVVTHNSINQLTLSFGAAYGGTVYLS